jgi:hypothetical protein
MTMINYTPTPLNRKGGKTSALSMIAGGIGAFGVGMARAWKSARTQEEKDAFPEWWKDTFGKKKEAIVAPKAPEQVKPVDERQVIEATTPPTVGEVSGAGLEFDTQINDQSSNYQQPGGALPYQFGSDGGYQDAWNSTSDAGVNVIPETTPIPTVETPAMIGGE